MAATITQQIKGAIPINRVSDFVPGNPNSSTCWRWATKGVRGVVLESFVCGGRRFVTPEALDRFLLALNSGNTPVEVGDADDHVQRGREACAALAGMGY